MSKDENSNGNNVSENNSGKDAKEKPAPVKTKPKGPQNVILRQAYIAENKFVKGKNKDKDKDNKNN